MNMKNPFGNSLKNPRLLFLSLILIEALFLFGHILKNRMIGAHDGIQYLLLQYSFLNGAATSGKIPHWIPHLTHGIISNWQFLFQAGLMQNLWLGIGPLLRNVNFLPLFIIGMFIDEVLLITGVWLLSQRTFLKTETRFYVTGAALAACLWAYQPWFNFHAFYLLPLCLHFLHRFWETKRWPYLFLSLNLLIVQNYGSIPYFLPLNLLFVVVYFGTHLLCQTAQDSRRPKGLCFGKGSWLALLGLLLSALPLYLLTYASQGDIILNLNSRAPDWLATAEGTYIGKTAAFSFYALDLLTGFITHYDYSLHIGISALPFIFLGLAFGSKRRMLPFLVTSAFFLFLTHSPLLAKILSTCWPLMHYFRHFKYCAVFIKIPLCFLAGFGFEAMAFPKSSRQKERLPSFALLLTAAFLLLFALSFRSLISQTDLFADLNLPDAPIIHKQFRPDVLLFWLRYNLTFSLCFCAAFFLLARDRTRPQRFWLICFILIVHVANIYTYKRYCSRILMTELSQGQQHDFDFRPLPYQTRRSSGPPKDNPRHNILQTLSSLSFHCSINTFLFEDTLDCSYRVDYWHKRFDRLMRGFWGQDPFIPNKKVLGVDEDGRLHFPSHLRAAAKMSGATADKIQIFQEAFHVQESKDVLTLITDPKFSGDLLFISGDQPQPKTLPPLRPWSDMFSLSKNSRLDLPYRVTSFSNNQISIEIRIPGRQGAWLFYSDNWHPFWQAKVNGQAVTVFPAYETYKALPLQPGKNIVQMDYHSQGFRLSTILIRINILILILFIPFVFRDETQLAASQKHG